MLAVTSAAYLRDMRAELDAGSFDRRFHRVRPLMIDPERGKRARLECDDKRKHRTEAGRFHRPIDSRPAVDISHDVGEFVLASVN